MAEEYPRFLRQTVMHTLSHKDLSKGELRQGRNYV